jgi:CHAT domain-containing protein
MANWYLTMLYEWLLRPVEELLPESSADRIPHLVIIPSGPLYYVPFQALVRTGQDPGQQAYLIEQYAITYAPSLTLLKFNEDIEAAAESENSVFLGLADPDTGSDADRLPEAVPEAYRVSVSYADARIFVGENASEDVVLYQTSDVQVLLLAAHGKFNPSNPMYSYIALAPSSSTDGQLHAVEVFELALQADLVVLSACETLLPALKDLEQQIANVQGTVGEQSDLSEEQIKALTGGDDVVGLTRAFLVAGARSVLSSLWNVPSVATADLMIAFFRHLREGMDKAHALRAAQLEVMSTDRYQHPYYWAAFNLMGDWR